MKIVAAFVMGALLSLAAVGFTQDMFFDKRPNAPGPHAPVSPGTTVVDTVPVPEAVRADAPVNSVRITCMSDTRISIEPGMQK